MFDKKSSPTSAWKKLALTNEEVAGMSKDKIEIHLNEQVTSPMPWFLAWFGRHWKFILITFIVLTVITGAILGIVFGGEWAIKAIIGIGWFFNLIFIKITGWAWLTTIGVGLIVMFVAKKLIKRDILAIVRYGSEPQKIKEYVISSTEEGYFLSIPRISFLGTLMFGNAKAKINSATWQYIQQNAKIVSHNPVGIKIREYRLLNVLPEEHSKEAILKRIDTELTLNPKCLIKERDVSELLVQNSDKKKKEQLANIKVLYNLTIENNNLSEKVTTLQIKVRNTPEDKLREHIRVMCPEVKQLSFDTYELLKERKEDLSPFDSIVESVEDSAKRIKELGEDKDE